MRLIKNKLRILGTNWEPNAVFFTDCPSWLGCRSLQRDSWLAKSSLPPTPHNDLSPSPKKSWCCCADARHLPKKSIVCITWYCSCYHYRHRTASGWPTNYLMGGDTSPKSWQGRSKGLSRGELGYCWGRREPSLSCQVESACHLCFRPTSVEKIGSAWVSMWNGAPCWYSVVSHSFHMCFNISGRHIYTF